VRDCTGGGTLVIGERSAEAQKMMAICGNQFFEGDQVDEGGEVCFQISVWYKNI
jgi:hypothetical protein